MGSTNKTTYFFKNKPLFGFDIGNGSLKVMQIEPAAAAGHEPRIIGYGTAKFDPAAVDNGVIVRPEIIAPAVLDLFQNKLVGDITTRRVAMAIPTYRTFTRAISLPGLKPKEL